MAHATFSDMIGLTAYIKSKDYDYSLTGAKMWARYFKFKIVSYDNEPCLRLDVLVCTLVGKSNKYLVYL